jgi:hypothetical protein
MDTLKGMRITAQSAIDKILSNGVIMGVVKIFLTMYIVRIAPEPPVYVTKIFENAFFKMFAIALIAYLSEVDFQLSILLGIVFVIGMNMLSGRQALESFINSAVYADQPQEWISDSSKVTTLLGKPTELGVIPMESKTDNYPGCINITMADLLKVFEGDAMKLQSHVEIAYQDLMNLMTDKDAKVRLQKIATAAGLNGNIPYTDANAPYIATILLNRGYKISESCQAPK